MERPSHRLSYFAPRPRLIRLLLGVAEEHRTAETAPPLVVVSDQAVPFFLAKGNSFRGPTPDLRVARVEAMSPSFGQYHTNLEIKA